MNFGGGKKNNILQNKPSPITSKKHNQSMQTILGPYLSNGKSKSLLTSQKSSCIFGAATETIKALLEINTLYL